MRCTKCHYLSFDPEPRCRNCGHDLSIDQLTEQADEVLGDAEAPQAADDLLASLSLTTDVPRATARPAAMAAAAPGGTGGGVGLLERPAVMTTELPLFVRDVPEDDGLDAAVGESVEDDLDLMPLIRVPSRPRAPLSVRRPTPDSVRLRAKYAPEPDLLDGVDDDDKEETPVTPTEAPRPMLVAPVAAGDRVAAAAIDASLLVAIAATVVWLTLRWVELPLAGVVGLPLLPLVAFVALIGLGYELMFTAANGQTVGKMAMGLRVVPEEDPDAPRVSLRQAAVRAVSLLPLGLGLVTALAGARLAVHDRLSHTRVVRA